VQASIPGGFVCRVHGGASPWARKKAAERLADLIDPDRALREAARIAYSDIRELFDADGRLRPMSEWPPDVAAAVRTLESREDAENGGRVVAVRLWDKPRALEFLLKHLGLLKEAWHTRVPSRADGKATSDGERRGGARSLKRPRVSMWTATEGARTIPARGPPCR
jgi:hypothetical protein